MTTLVFFMLVFLAVGVFFLFFHLVLGRFVRPVRPSPEKLTIYECGEPTIGSAWVQFDLRYYVVALLFVIFDVEVAFFFPWATVFGKANTLAQEGITAEKRLEITNELTPPYLPATEGDNRGKVLPPAPIKPETAKTFAWLAMLDMAIFFGVLLVGFAYLWRRGDINWVRSTVAERLAAQPRAAPMGVTSEEELVGAGQRSSV